MPIAADSQRLAPGSDIIELFDLDCTPIGGGVFRFVAGNLGAANVKWRGNEYTPIPIQATGFEVSGRGSLPTPSITIAATSLVIAASLSIDNLRGARVTRWKTFLKYLDGQPNADRNQHFRPEIWSVERLRRHNTQEAVIEWELSASLDQEGRKIPGRIASRDWCPWRYRRSNGSGGFSYEQTDCPYTGNRFFKQDDTPTSDPRQDRCSKRLTGCKLRFGEFNPLPYGGWPGVGKSRV
jgi:lambda family phage minor tail protein L